jgi:hypothetical protein
MKTAGIIQTTLPRALALTAGAAGWMLAQKIPAVGLTGGISWVYEKVGITIVALVPLAVWSVYTALRAGKHNDITLAYIGTTAQRIGLLGTVIGIVLATVRIGDSLSSGAASAVTSALPAVGQALVSTAVGFLIAIVCDFFRYLNASGHARELIEEEKKSKE